MLENQNTKENVSFFTINVIQYVFIVFPLSLKAFIGSLKRV